MKQKLILFFIGIFIFSISGFSEIKKQTGEQKEETTELYSISEIKAVLELADVGFYPEIVNDPLKALEYKGDRRIAANIGVYLADLIYVMSTAEREDAYKNYGAIMELSKNVGLTDEMPKLILERYEKENIPAEEVYAMIEKALDEGNKNLTGHDKSVFFAYMIMGNYIEKLYVVSSIIMRPKKTELPAEVEATLKRGLLQYVSKQSGRLQKLLDLMTTYAGDGSDILVRAHIENIMNSYKTVEAKRDELISLPPGELYKAKEVVDIYNQIKSIRNRIVN